MKKEIYSASVCFCILISSFIYAVQIEKTGVHADTVIPPGHIISDTLWTLSGSPYYVEGDVYLDKGVNLTIEPGVDVRFNGYYSLYINGTLNAVGNPNNFINFTSNISTPNPGDWEQIRINPYGFVKMEFCNLSFGHDPLYLEYSNGSVIKNNIIYNSSHCALIIHYSNGVNVSNNLFLSNKMIGVSAYGSSNNTYYNNSFFDTARYSFLINGDQQAHFNNFVDISNKINNKPICYFHNINDTVISSLDVGMIEVAWSNNITLSNCKTIDADPIIFNLVNNSTIFNCNSSGNFIGLWLIRSNRNRIDTNSVYNNRWHGISLYQYCKNNTVVNNIASGNGRSGILIYFLSQWNNITRNVASNNHYDGIQLFSTACNHNVISENIISNNNPGIGFSNGDYNKVCFNRIFSNSGGLILGNAYYNHIYMNNFTSTGAAININNMFTADNYNYIYLNNFYSNGIGLNIGNSKKNKIFNNNFIDNQPTQASETGSGNYFNETYPISGNYWSDYNGIDLNSTPSQNVPPPDGIGDTPYDIDFDSKDYYPLINPHPNAGIPSIYLYEGWNLISLPLIQEDQRLGEVLENISGEYDSVQLYNKAKKDDPWKHYKTNKPFGNDLINLNESIGFWIHITKPGGTYFNYTGSLPSTYQQIPLYIGWNLVGYPSLTSYNRTDGLNNLTFDMHVDAILTYNASTQTWKKLSPSDYFETGRGYWIHALTKCEWEVPL